MANSLRIPMASSLPFSSSSSSSGLNRTRRHRMAPVNASNFALPPVNPNDHFLARLASVAAKSPETLLNRPKNPDSPPYMDLFDSPQLMATPAQLERSVSYNEHKPRSPPPDLPSILLHGRIVYIGMPLVPAVTELVIAQLLYLQYMDPKETIYLYINSTGTTRDDGETVAMEGEGFAIYNTLTQLKNEIQTVGVGAAVGHACLLLAAGAKGKRYMMPSATAMIQQPRVPSSGLMSASDVAIQAREVIINRDILVELLAKHTGNSKETVANKMRRPFYMNSVKAKEFGVIDKILWRGQEELMKEVAPPEYWDKNSRSKILNNEI